MNASTVSSLPSDTHPPCLNPPSGSSVAESGDWMTPSMLMKFATTTCPMTDLRVRCAVPTILPTFLYAKAARHSIATPRPRSSTKHASARERGTTRSPTRWTTSHAACPTAASAAR